MYRKYDSKVPAFLHNRPKGLVQHIMKRAYPEYTSSFVKKCGQELFMVKSESCNERYQVWLGSDTQLPSCQCIDYKINRLPCKHLCAVVSLPDVGWQSLGASFNNHPLFRLDSAVVTNTSSAQSSETQNSDGEDDDTFLDQPENVDTAAQREPPSQKSHAEYNQLKKRKRGMERNVRAKCISTLKALNDELYVVKDKQVLAKLELMVYKALIYARENRPAENNLPLKDKTLSPNRKKRKVSRVETSLPLRAKRRKKKRFGVGADNRERAANLTITSNGSINNKGKTKENPSFIDMTALEDDMFEDKSKTPQWLTVQGIKLTSKSRDSLMNHNGWLSDKHVDAAQRLLKSMKTGIGGLNDVVVMTHFKKTRVHIATKDCQTIQCHNIGGHWVVSTSIHGKVTLYESLSTGLNKTVLPDRKSVV